VELLIGVERAGMAAGARGSTKKKTGDFVFSRVSGHLELGGQRKQRLGRQNSFKTLWAATLQPVS
jgi:hypothetical protein